MTAVCGVCQSGESRGFNGVDVTGRSDGWWLVAGGWLVRWIILPREVMLVFGFGGIHGFRDKGE